VEWQTTGIEVTIKETHPEPGLRRQTGIIRNVLVSTLKSTFLICILMMSARITHLYYFLSQVGSCAVYLLKEERVVNVGPEHLVPNPAKIHDRVKVISGEFRENTGTLVSLDGQDGVVEIDGDVKLLPLSFLAKMAGGD